MHEQSNEVKQVAARYSKRASLGVDARYSMLNPSVWKGVQERQRALISVLSVHAPKALSDMRVLEVGCGSGGNLLELLRLGFDPRNILANELLPERAVAARRNLPASISLHEGDALTLDLQPGSMDIVYQSTVFTSLLDDAFQAALAQRMWEWVRPGGAVLWYDFTFNNPRNPDVRGVSLARIKELFPEGHIDSHRVTLAPPIARRVTQIHPVLYDAFNLLPVLRTHVLCWIGKV